ncbi:single-stranded-dna-specific exonuclease recj [hydrocarbon metagenome]|uniref:Single-stranded-DNA-specific exonuclease RecJ n=1 Tax=hydrocarbon metagenome TaxID=938273 RepID=A0A0W8G5Z5_9ZZZZ
MSVAKTWRVRGREGGVAGMGDRLGVSELVVDLLRGRGLATVEEMDVYLSPGLRHLMSPGEIPGLTRGAEAVAAGLAAGKRLAVWGDYDVDGVTGTALLLDFLRQRGTDAAWYVPNRLEEGYGLNMAGIEALARDGVSLLVTVDCGITNVAEVARARELGMTVVVTDHHLPGKELPPADAVCDPKLSDNAGSDLAGVGVAFFLAAALNRMLPGQPCDVRGLLDLVAMGTLADVVPLRGQNRILVKNGLLLLSEAARPGVRALREVCGQTPGTPIGVGQVGFGLAPRINAAGRMGRADAALDMLLARDMDTARPLAAFLDRENAERRKEEERILEEARAQAETFAPRASLTLHGPGWHSGIIGIVASRIVEATHKPTLIVTEEGGILKGSGRSIKVLDIHEALTEVSDLFVKFGGHRQAAGFSLAGDGVAALRERFEAAVVRRIGAEPVPPVLTLDGELGFSRIDAGLVREIELLQPFGPGNPEPLFSSPPVVALTRRTFGGGGDHVVVSLRDESARVTLRGKGWRMAGEIAEAVVGRAVRVAFTPRLDTYDGLPRIELRLKDVRGVDASV